MTQDAAARPSQTGGIKLDHATALAIGFGLHNAWICSLLYAANSPFEEAFQFAGLQGSTITPFYIISTIAFSLTALIACLFDQKLLRFARSRTFILVAALITSLGSFALLIPVPNFAASAAIEIFIGITSGFGSACLAIVWGVSFAREKVSVIATSGSIAYALGYVLNVLVVQGIPSPFNFIIIGLIPLAEFAILSAIIPAPIVNPNEYLPFNALPTSKNKLGVRLIVPLVLVGFALGILKALSVQTTLGAPVNSDLFLMLFLAGSLSVALFVVFSQVKTSISWDTFLRVIVPIIACASLLASLLSLDSPLYSNLFMLITYILLESLMWIAYAYLAHTCRLSPIFIVGLSRCLLSLSMLANVLLPAVGTSVAPNLIESQAFIILVVLGCIVVGYLIMPKESEVLKLVVSCPAVRLIELEMSEGLGVLGAMSARGTVLADASTNNAASPSVQNEAAPQQVDGEPDAKTKQPISEARAAMLGADEHKESGGKFSQKVKKTAETFLLTERETDILFELAKGNSPKYIEGKYYISAGTVKTHIRNIYHKLDVHKRDELIRLIESMDD